MGTLYFLIWRIWKVEKGTEWTLLHWCWGGGSSSSGGCLAGPTLRGDCKSCPTQALMHGDSFDRCRTIGGRCGCRWETLWPVCVVVQQDCFCASVVDVQCRVW